MREEDGVFVCSRCGLVNPTSEQPCVPVVSDPSTDLGFSNDSSKA